MAIGLHILQRDRDAFDHLCKGNYASLIYYARLFVPLYVAEDVVQDVFFCVWQKRNKLDLSSDLSRYLVRSVYNRCMNIIAKEKVSSKYVDSCRHRITSLLSSDYLDPDNNPAISCLYSADLRKTLDSAISSLPDRCAEVFRLSYEEHLSQKEISERLGISISTVENHIYNALRKLRVRLVSVDSH